MVKRPLKPLDYIIGAAFLIFVLAGAWLAFMNGGGLL